MSKFSRVKKNVDLYNKILEEDKTKIIESSLRDYERRTTDPHSMESAYQASRYRKNKDLIDELAQEEFEQPSDLKENVKSEKPAEALFKKEILRDRDLLEEFIEEVKHYNINRGLRNVQDTQMNILQNLSKKPQDSDDKSQIKAKSEASKSDLELTQEIQAIINELDEKDLESDYDDEGSDNFVYNPLPASKEEELSSIYNEIKSNAKQSQKPDKAVFSQPEEKDTEKAKQESKASLPIVENNSKRDFKSSELLELTQTLNLKLDLQEAELEEVSEKVGLIDKILTGFLLVLVLALVVIIAYGIFWVYRERGGF